MTLRALAASILSLGLFFSGRPAAADTTKLKVAVLQTATKRQGDRDLGAVVAELLLEQMTKLPEVGAFGEADALGLLGDGARKQLEGCNEDSACMIEIGGALGVEYLLSSSLGSIGSNYMLVVRLLSTADGTIAARVSETVAKDEDALAAAICPLMQKLLVDAGVNAPKLVPPPNLCGAPEVAVAAPQAPVVAEPVVPATPPQPQPTAVEKVAEVPNPPLPTPSRRPSFAVRGGLGGHMGVLGLGVEWRPSWFGVAVGTGSHLVSGGLTFGSSENRGGFYGDLHFALVRPGLVSAMSPLTSGYGAGASVGWDFRFVPWLSVKTGVGAAWNSLDTGNGPLFFDLNVGPVF